MEKRELSYSDCIVFLKYIQNARDGIFEMDFKAIQEHIDSAKKMVLAWLFDGKINVFDVEWLTHLLTEATEDYEVDDIVTLSDTLSFTSHEFRKMMKRYDIKQDN